MGNTQLESLDERLDSFHRVMFDSPGYFFIKDMAGRFLYSNKNLLLETGSNTLSSLLGKTDFMTPWERYATVYTQADHKVTTTKAPFQQQELIENYKKETILLTTHKKPFYHGDKLIGIHGASLQIPPSCLGQRTTFSEGMEFVDLQRGQRLTLTSRHKQILYYVLKGHPAKQIAAILGISYRTVEHHIESIKTTNRYASIKSLLLAVNAV
jgi:DNA-binding CsgD family transcriptional regulator